MKSSFDTSLGGEGREFPATTWGLVSQFQGSVTEEQHRALAELAQRYWKPVYCLLRLTHARAAEDAKDLTQAFFLWLCEGDALQKYQPARGGFRTYLKILLRSFSNHQERALQRLKRGGGARILSLDQEAGSLESSIPLPGSSDPDQMFDRQWQRTLVDNATKNLRRKLQAEGREKQIRTFELYDLVPEEERPTYARLAEQLGMKESDVRYALVAVRQELRSEIRAELARLTANDAELEEEWNAFLGP